MENLTPTFTTSSIPETFSRKIRPNHPSVFRRLRIGDVPDSFVEGCLAGFERVNGGSVDELVEIELMALNEGRSNEMGMHGPLLNILNYIVNFPDPSDSDPHPRKIVDEQALFPDSTTFDFGFSAIKKPDFTILSRNASPSSTTPSEKFWTLRDMFIELKASREQCPGFDSPNSETIPDIVWQSANYARLHLAARPFSLFSIGLMITGSSFSAGIFDRDGVTVSPVHSLWDPHTRQLDHEGIRIFIKLVRSVTCILSDEEVGYDPTVTEIELTDGSPAYICSLGGSESEDDINTRRWCTVGPPFWRSVSYTGRGTQVWAAREYRDGKLVGPEMVLKTAWRTLRRTPEAEIYGLVEGTHPGLAEFVDGRDVAFPGQPSTPISVYGLRGYEPDEDGTERILHRLILNTVGRPLWEYGSDLELVRAVRAAVLAHKFLFEHGILHCDVSAGNVLLNKSASSSQSGSEGFLTDLELAHVDVAVVARAYKSVQDAEPVINSREGGCATVHTQTARERLNLSDTQVEHADAMTGTAQFIALELLSPPRTEDGAKETHGPHHDLESFLQKQQISENQMGRLGQESVRLLNPHAYTGLSRAARPAQLVSQGRRRIAFGVREEGCVERDV